MKKYTINVVIQEGSDEFWESLNGKSGCDEIKECVCDCLATQGFFDGDNCFVKLIKFEETT